MVIRQLFVLNNLFNINQTIFNLNMALFRFRFCSWFWELVWFKVGFRLKGLLEFIVGIAFCNLFNFSPLRYTRHVTHTSLRSIGKNTYLYTHLHTHSHTLAPDGTWDVHVSADDKATSWKQTAVGQNNAYSSNSNKKKQQQQKKQQQ